MIHTFHFRYNKLVDQLLLKNNFCDTRFKNLFLNTFSIRQLHNQTLFKY